MKINIFLFLLIFSACNSANKPKEKVSVTQVYNGITVTANNITCTEAQLQNNVGKLQNPKDTLAVEDLKALKLFVTGYTPVNGMVNLVGSLTLINANSPNDTLFTKNDYFTNTPISNGDARFINMPFAIKQGFRKVNVIASLKEINTGNNLNVEATILLK